MSLKKLSFYVLSIMPALAWSGQEIIIPNNGEGMAQIARTSLNRIYLNEDHVAQITSLNGELVIQKDTENGQFFVKPTDEQRENPIEIFISTEKGNHFALSLKPLTVKAQNIGILLEQPKQKINDEKLITLVKEMNELDFSSKLTQELIPEEISHVGSLRVAKRQTIRDGKLVGEVYELKNENNGQILIDQHQYWNEGVLAVAFEKEVLKEGETTKLFMVKNYG
ncbi:MAG: type-F conjugative transfer system secretin TraK [Candidatus Babeliales bacterium]